MEHVFFVLYSLASMLGIIVLAFLAVSFVRYGDDLLKKYFILMLLVFFLFTTEVIEIYGIISNLEFLKPASFFSISIYKLLEIAIFLYVPMFVFRLVNNKQQPFIIVLCIGGGVVLAGYTAYSLYSENIRISNTLEIIFALWTAFWVFFLFYKSRKRYSAPSKKMVYILGSIILIFCPFLFIDIILTSSMQFFMHPFFNSISLPFLVFFVIWNGLNLYFGITYYSKRSSRHIVKSIPKNFIMKYDITEREKEIINQIIKGLTNKEIAYNLDISDKTVKNHIYNIYKKTEVQSRIELLIQVINLNHLN